MPRPIGRITPTRPDGRPVKITFAELREMGVRGVLIYCADYRCGHWLSMRADCWPDDLRLSDLEPHFTCTACGRRGAEVRPDFDWNTTPSGAMGYRNTANCRDS